MSTALTIASGTLQSYSEMSQGVSANNAAKQNARNMEQQAKNTYRTASLEEDRMRRSAAQIIGNQLAMGAQSGVALSGSRLDALRESYTNVERDAAKIRTNAAIEGTGLENQARETRWQGKQAKKAGMLSAIMTGVNTAASAYAKSAGAETDKNPGAAIGKDAGMKAGESLLSTSLSSNQGYDVMSSNAYNKAYNTLYGGNNLLKNTSYGFSFKNKQRKIGSL